MKKKLMSLPFIQKSIKLHQRDKAKIRIDKNTCIIYQQQRA